MSRSWTRPEERRLAELYQQGAPVDGLATEFGRTEAAVRGKVREMGVRRGAGYTPRGRRRRIDYAQAYALRAEGLSWPEISERLGCSHVAARRSALIHAAEQSLPAPADRIQKPAPPPSPPLYWHHPARPGRTLCGRTSTGELVATSYRSVDCPDCLSAGLPEEGPAANCGLLGRQAYQLHAQGQTWGQVGAQLLKNTGHVWCAARSYARRERLPWPPSSEAA